MAEDPLADLGELVFSIVISYFGAMEFFFVLRQLVHWSGRHETQAGQAQGTQNSQLNDLNEQLVAAQAREAATGGLNVMQDGVAYENGFRVEPANLNSSEERKREIEAELERQRFIEIETRRQLEEAEAKLAEERIKVKDDEEKRLLEQIAAAVEQERQLSLQQAEQEAAENTRKLIEAEKQREAEERQKEEAHRKETEANERKLLEAEKERIEAERQREIAEHERIESERRLLDAEKQREAEQRRLEQEEDAEAAQARRDAEIVERLLEAERARKMSATESELEEEEAVREAALQARRLISNENEREEKQKLIEENARLFLEAEEEMVVLQQRMLEAAQANEYRGEAPVVEEPCVKKIIPPKFEANEINEPIVVQKVKTQFGQTSSEQPYSVSSKPLLFPGVSDEGSSLEPVSSQQSSSFSTQASEELTPGGNGLETERQEPDGEDNVPEIQYTDEYLRSLDGIKSRPLLREDGSGRRRAFKKRRSSGSSNSSRESRTSREEEVRMFTSLEEEELRQGEKDDYNPIKYTSEPTLRVKSHHRRHKRSPAKDAKSAEGDDSLRGSLEMLGEESTNPWGELVPEHYKDMEFWKREKAMSIDEEEIDLEQHPRAASGEVDEVFEEDDGLKATNLPNASSFEEATSVQNKEAATALQQRQLSKEVLDKDNSEANKEPTSSSSDSKSNLQTSHNTEDANNAQASSSPRLRRSPRIEEIDQYEERWREADAAAAKTSTSSTSPLISPTISIHPPDVGPWRDQHGLMMEGLSDFYDFTASVNPSRSRSTSRNPSPVNTAPNTPQPRNVANEMNVDSSKTVDVYDDTNELIANEIKHENIISFIESNIIRNAADQENSLCDRLQNVADKPSAAKEEISPMIYATGDNGNEMNSLIQTLREERCRSDTRSRSRSPLPTSDNLEKSLAIRRNRLIKHNDEVFEKLSKNSSSKEDVALDFGINPDDVADFVDSLLTDRKSRSKSRSPLRSSIEIKIDANDTMICEIESETTTQEETNMSDLVETLRAQRISRSRSRSRSPLPTSVNIEKSLATRRSRLIQHNEEVFEKLTSTTSANDNFRDTQSRSPTLIVRDVESDSQEVFNNTEMKESDHKSVTNSFETLHAEQRLRSRSRSPLPNSDRDTQPRPTSPIDAVNDIQNSPHAKIKEDGNEHESMSQFVETLRVEQRSRSRSRSRSPLPTSENLEKSIASRRDRLIQHNDEILEKLKSTNSAPLLVISDESIDSRDVEINTNQVEPDIDMCQFVETLRAEQRSRSRSRSHSPLPTAHNLEKGIATRRNRLIKHNDEIFDKLIANDEDRRSIDRPKSPIPRILDMETNQDKTEDENCLGTQENIREFVESLRVEQRSRSRSRSPLPSSENIERSIASRHMKRIQQNDELFEKFTAHNASPDEIPSQIVTILPTISVECFESEITSITSMKTEEEETEEEDTTEHIMNLVEKLRLNRSRSRSRSKTPLPPSVADIQKHNESLVEQLEELAHLPDPPNVTLEYIDVLDENNNRSSIERDLRSLSPSRSRSPTPERLVYEDNNRTSGERDLRSLSPSRSRSRTPESHAILAHLSDNYDFHVMLNLEASDNRTLSKNSEEYESVLAAKQREVDREALEKLTNANEEVELRLLSPTDLEHKRLELQQDSEAIDSLADLPLQERMRILRCSPTTPEYERTISEECRDVERIKQEMLASGFKRSTYVGESVDLGSEQFRRSLSPSPSLESTSDLITAREHAAVQRELQAAILDSLCNEPSPTGIIEENRTGAKPKTYDYDRTLSEEVLDTQRIKDEILSGGFKRSTYVGESVDLAAHLDDMRHRTAEFQRSRSQSRSPPAEEQVDTLKNIDAEAVRRELQDQLLDQFTASTVNFQNFSRHLNADFLDSERRASDSALMQKPDDLFSELEPEEYHHYRRYSLAQEQPVEEYPNDDFICISQIEVRTLTGTRTWLKEDFYSEDFDESQLNILNSEESIDNQQEGGEEYDATTGSWNDELTDANSSESIPQGEFEIDDYDPDQYDSNDSEDERQTVVEIEDEFDEGISDYNERGGPTDESHHETSECEEAERNADRYADRGANDWGEDDVENVDEFLDYGIEEGAVGGVTPYSDPDSFIEQIYNDAIKNRKQSGILRDYESIFQDIQTTGGGGESAESETEVKGNSESDRNTLCRNKLDSERRDGEMRYLGDANVSARQSARLRSRYGYNPQLQSSTMEQDIDVDLNYKPRREYKWRKNFKLDDEDSEQSATANIENEEIEMKNEEDNETNYDLGESLQDYDDLNAEYIDMRRYSFGGESITLFSRSPEKMEQVPEERNEEELNEEPPMVTSALTEPMANEGENSAKPKKKKIKGKKKTRKGSKTELEDAKDEDDSENQMYSRRSSSIHGMETDSPKRKSRSRRSSKTSLTNEDGNSGGGLFSPRNSLGFVMDGITDIAEEGTEIPSATTATKKKTKKRKKSIKEEVTMTVTDIKEEEHITDEVLAAALSNIAPISISTNLSPTSEQLLVNVSAAESICVTPASSTASTESRNADGAPISPIAPAPTTTTTTTAVATRSIVDSFDILKDANFYPLF